MKDQTAARLTQLFDMGYVLHIQAGRYITSFVTSIGKEDYDVEGSPYVYSDDTMADRLLSEVSLSDVQVFQRVNIWEVDDSDEPLQEGFENQEPEDNDLEEDDEDDTMGILDDDFGNDDDLDDFYLGDEPEDVDVEKDEYIGKCAQCRGPILGEAHWVPMDDDGRDMAYICTTCLTKRLR